MSQNPDPPRFSPRAILRVLLENNIRFVVIGGIAAVARGVEHGTADLDVAADGGPENLDRINRALLAMNAGIRREGTPEPLHRLSSGEWLGFGAFWNFTTDLGNFDVLFAPSGVESFDALAASAEILDLGGGATVAVASIEALIQMKEAANRPKDQDVLSALRWLRDQSPLSGDESRT